MREIETDYLVVGAGASGMAFADALVTAADVDVVMVDRRHSPGGHWLDDYSFVRLHQPSANYGVNSRVLGQDRIDETGPNAGFYERATAAEICDYFSRVLDEVLVPSGQVRFFGMTDYRGADGDGHHLTSLLTGEETIVRVRRRFVDATYVESSIPSRHAPPFSVDTDVRMIPPNGLVDLDEPASGFTILGAGKTAMDTCNWLLDQGVDPGRIQWFRPRDPWLFDRRAMQPLDLVADYMDMQASWVGAAAEAEDGMDFARRLEAGGVFLRIDPHMEPTVFRGATISSGEIDSLRTIEQVIPGRRVLRIGTDRIVTDDGDLAAEPGRVYVDCTAQGVRPTVPRPIFEGDRMTLQYVTIGIVPWSAAIVGTVEARQADDAEKNRLCPTVQFTGNVVDMPRLSYAGMDGITVRTMDPDLNAWNDAARLNPAGAATKHLDDPRVQEAFASMGAKFGAAMANLARQTGTAPASVG
ncbi:MAG TPA: NAD(P)-binding protein [Acidimicrobiales bacterium]|nr:NAD(P)-binding protein [Acidimicrobiales bacterium]